jgi:hypothetical protein
MGIIYGIKNNLTNKIYIGKTLETIEKRWKEHCNDCQKERCEKRPLYLAMKKYGVENFFIEEVEYCNYQEVNEREKYWIEFYGSFKYGYNATLGGDGRSYIDRELVLKTYINLQNCEKVASVLDISRDTVAKILKENNIYTLSNQEVNEKYYGKSILMLNVDNKEEQVFPSLAKAAEYLINNNEAKGDIKGIKVHIREVCNKKRKTASGFKWEFC